MIEVLSNDDDAGIGGATPSIPNRFGAPLLSSSGPWAQERMNQAYAALRVDELLNQFGDELVVNLSRLSRNPDDSPSFNQGVIQNLLEKPLTIMAPTLDDATLIEAAYMSPAVIDELLKRGIIEQAKTPLLKLSEYYFSETLAKGLASLSVDPRDEDLAHLMNPRLTPQFIFILHHWGVSIDKDIMEFIGSTYLSGWPMTFGNGDYFLAMGYIPALMAIIDYTFHSDDPDIQSRAEALLRWFMPGTGREDWLELWNHRIETRVKPITSEDEWGTYTSHPPNNAVLYYCSLPIGFNQINATFTYAGTNR